MAFGDLCALADVKAWLQTGQNAFPSTDDLMLTRLITAASGYIQTWLNRPVLAADWAETRDGDGGHRMQFGIFPVSAVLSLTIDGVAIMPAPPPAFAGAGSQQGWTAGYAFSPTQLVLRGYRFTRRAQNVAIVYTAGWPTPPFEIAQACIELVALRYRERTRIGETSRHLGDGATAAYTTKDMTDPIKTLLQQYRLVAPVIGIMPVLAPTATDPTILAAAA